MTKEQCRAARALLGWKLLDLAAASHVTKNAIQLFETGVTRPHRVTIEALTRALEEAGVEFTNGGKPGVCLARSPS
jgi:transcriptional regulator with XRE-family HTH domain